ncbi:ferritin-like domain-containing protein [Cytophagaceae bacterium BD1B2-1]|uniref:Ferritin-like domain-containing protein n=2 Tax=Xanthocytophaga agilis TaxID=3048010 RepID=A0AAE3R0F7_9BACT|nr:ferritin-like domain-containing protein [Xanthocytophaga agilis]MDJ1501449.1 ferritin-like domain-containing protein [Xanthocytophaga agilis]
MQTKGMLTPMGRGSFLKYLGASAALTALVLTGCKDDDDDMTIQGVNLGSGDTGILNYAYALEQLEAAFYSQVISSKYSGMSSAEQEILTEIRDHELVHRDFFKAALGSNAIGSLQVDFSSIDFSSRTAVLGAAKVFEDLGVSAYNGAGKLLQSADFLLIAGKIVSVEARHAAAIRDLLNPNSADFAGDDIVTASNGLDAAKAPSDVLTAAKSYIKNTINASNLPQS